MNGGVPGLNQLLLIWSIILIRIDIYILDVKCTKSSQHLSTIYKSHIFDLNQFYYDSVPFIRSAKNILKEVIYNIYLLLQRMANTLKERSKNLTSISLESFISDVTAEGENHCFSELLSHPNIHTVKPQYQHLINLFAYGTYKDYIQKKYEVSELNEKQTHTLRRLSILSAIKGVEATTIIKLQTILGVGHQQVIDLLLAMNISGHISTKIDEQKGKVLILAAELRAEKEPLNKGVLRAKITLIVQKNQSISQEISSIQKIVG